jgi:hypothetical protein
MGGQLSRRPRVRPYVLTHGRTRADGIEVPLDAAVRARTKPDDVPPWSSPEARTIVVLCAEPLPLVEVAARVEVPLGVARVLVGDLVGDGLVSVNEARPPDAHTDVALLERLLDGIRAL